MSTLRARGINTPQPLRLPGGNLAAAGQDVQQQAARGIDASTRLASEREATNAEIRSSNKAGSAKLGSAVGGVVGSFWGPVGAMVGSAAGGLIGSMF